uniref:glutathione transferase n=1 Tax=Araucaria cunninghamii TaxID=56994 RepID=A0A0D6QUS5_ARACU
MASNGEKVKVFTFSISPFVNRVLIALEEMGVPYDSQEVDMNNKSPEFLEANPVYKKVPAIVHNGKPLSESLVILEYIHDTWSSSPSAGTTLMPKDPYDKAIARFWADFVDKKFWAAGWRTAMTEGESQEEAKMEFVDSFLLLEEALRKTSGGKPFFGGDTFGYLDIVLAPYISLWPAVEILGDFKIPFDRCPHLSAWAQLVSQRQSVKKILPTPETALELIAGRRKQALSTSN